MSIFTRRIILNLVSISMSKNYLLIADKCLVFLALKNLKPNRAWYNYLFIIIMIVSLITLSTVEFHQVYNVSPPALLSLSSDGNYAITSHDNGDVFLWNIVQHKKKLLARHANPFGAYFIKHSHNFMWQDKNNKVHIQNIYGENIIDFTLNYAVYGHVMTTDLRHYIASDGGWNLYAGYGNKQYLFKIGDKSGFTKSKLLNLYLSADDKYLLTSGSGSGWDDYPLYTGKDALQKNVRQKGETSLLDGVVLWSLQTLEPIQKFPYTHGDAIAALSWDNLTAITGDMVGFMYQINLTTKAAMSLDDLSEGHFVGEDHISKESVWDKTGLIPLPEDFPVNSYPVFAIKLIDMAGHYLRFTYGVYYAALYHLSTLKPKKYFAFNKNTWLSLHDYKYDQALDTAPAANILAISRLETCGIVVYHFDTKTQTLNKVWES